MSHPIYYTRYYYAERRDNKKNINNLKILTSEKIYVQRLNSNSKYILKKLYI